tara:strand:- start:1014 stop:1373 length:360 start_codon:yes stop_codon:yes gene_type:complete
LVYHDITIFLTLSFLGLFFVLVNIDVPSMPAEASSAFIFFFFALIAESAPKGAGREAAVDFLMPFFGARCDVREICLRDVVRCACCGASVTAESDFLITVLLAEMLPDVVLIEGVPVTC